DRIRSIRVDFFFSSRRRHTRWPRDWSSDVCSSDLGDASTLERTYAPLGGVPQRTRDEHTFAVTFNHLGGKSFDLGLAALLVITVAGQVAFSIRVSTLLEPARFIVRIEGFSGRFARLGRGSLDQAAISFVCLRGEAF